MIFIATIAKSFRVDEKLYEDAKAVFEKLGMPFSVGMNIYFEYVVREQGIPFALSLRKDEKHEPAGGTD